MLFAIYTKLIVPQMSFLDLVFPKNCLNCKKDGCYICRDCLNKVKRTAGICAYCQKASIDGMTHFKCRRKFRLDGLVSVWEYEGVIRKAILALKYKFAKEVAKELSERAVSELKNHNSLCIIPDSIMVSVPLHKRRENWRGFNQSNVLGSEIAKALGHKFVSDLLIRKNATASQTELKGKERRENVRGIFALNPIYKLRSTGYILFDDVFTTGSTLKEAAKVLKRGGAEKVWGLTIAR